MIFIPQHDKKDCGVACLAMVSNYYGKKYSLQYLRDLSFVTREGASLLGISEAAKKIGFETTSVQLDSSKLNEMPLPCILHWNKKHFVVLYNISTGRISKNNSYHIADPRHGKIKLKDDDFEKSWVSHENTGVALLLEPAEDFDSLEPVKNENLNLKYIFHYLSPYKKKLIFMFLLLLAGSSITFILPFLTKNLIDKGVNAKNINFIEMILLAQLTLFLSSMFIDFIRNWLMLYVGTKINIKIISDFFAKIFKLPIRFFETKVVGDFNQRIQDQERIENFLTSQSLITLFSIITFSVFFSILWYYDYKILLVHLVLTVLSVLWSVYFLKKRRFLDYIRFQQRSENQESIYEIITGVTEMKLNQLEDYKRSEWENLQHKLFKINIKILRLDQFQMSGFEFLNQLKNILVTFLASTFVVQGKMSLGELLSVSYIVGQMNSPVNQLVSFFRSLQDAKLSLERLNEIQNQEEEEKPGQIVIDRNSTAGQDIDIKNVSFQYEGSNSPYVLKNISFFIPDGKITAIVGASGSGKTTLIKMLLKFYEPTNGAIYLGRENLNSFSSKNLRKESGVVMQDGFIFSDTIERNIASGDTVIDEDKLDHAVRTANIREFILSLPLGYKTKIGSSGNGISGGQKQRILIARAVYKNPHFIFFDEATSALDAENEKIIHDNLQTFFKGKTVVIVAHRLSTVKNADQIIVLKNGEIVEQGNHHQLVQNKADYFNLVKNQLELGT